MPEPAVDTKISGGSQTGFVSVGTVSATSIVINNYTDTPREPARTNDDIGTCPYPGLEYFGPNDAARFFGRAEAIDRLMRVVRRQSFTAVVGASGSGKSSVVLAGFAPHLQREEAWCFSYFRFSNELDFNPFTALARALKPLLATSNDAVERLTETNSLASKLRSGDLTLRDVFSDCRSRTKGSRILLIADQFEEIFTLVADETERCKFFDVLLAGLREPTAGVSPDVCLILTLRADFYGHALLHRPLADALQGHVENLGPMKREEMRKAIVQPAEDANVSFEPGLVETLLDGVESKPGSLPLLQFALREMWWRQENRTITCESYDAIGGVQGALVQHAETIFGRLTADSMNQNMEKSFRRLFTRLVTPGEGQEDTRRVAERRELGDEAWSLAQLLASQDNRLIITNAPVARNDSRRIVTDPPAPSHETAEMVHEALIGRWPRLANWINRDRAFLSWLRQIKPNVELWSADPSDEGPLLRGGMLAQAEAQDWLARRDEDFSPKERSFIEASLALRRRAEEEKEAARRRQRFAWAGLAAASMAGIFGLWERNLALDQTHMAQKNLAAVVSVGNRITDFAHDLSNIKGISQDTTLLVLRPIEAAMEALLDESQDSPELSDLRIKVDDDFADLYWFAGDINRARQYITQSFTLGGKVIPANAAPETQIERLKRRYHEFLLQGDILRVLGELDASQNSFGIARDTAKAIIGLTPDQDAQGWQQYTGAVGRLGDVERTAGHFAKAAVDYQEIKVVQEQFLKRQPGDKLWLSLLSWSYNRLGDNLLHITNHEGLMTVAADRTPFYRNFTGAAEALDDYEKALRIRRNLESIHDSKGYYERGRDVVWSLALCGMARLPTDTAQALKLLEEGLTKVNDMLGSDGKNTELLRYQALIYNFRGDAFFLENKNEQAFAEYKRGLDVRKNLTTIDTHNVRWLRDEFYTLDRMHSLYKIAGQADRAACYRNEALSLSARVRRSFPTDQILAETNMRLDREVASDPTILPCETE